MISVVSLGHFFGGSWEFRSVFSSQGFPRIYIPSLSCRIRELARQFCCNCNEKLFGSHIHSFLHLERSSIMSSPAGCQSANGLVKSHWKIMVHMSHVYLMEKQMPCSFWYYAIKHSARMMNMIPGRYRNQLASPFMLVHGVRPDQRT